MKNPVSPRSILWLGAQRRRQAGSHWEFKPDAMHRAIHRYAPSVNSYVAVLTNLLLPGYMPRYSYFECDLAIVGGNDLFNVMAAVPAIQKGYSVLLCPTVPQDGWPGAMLARPEVRKAAEGILGVRINARETADWMIDCFDAATAQFTRYPDLITRLGENLAVTTAPPDDIEGDEMFITVETSDSAIPDDELPAFGHAARHLYRQSVAGQVKRLVLGRQQTCGVFCKRLILTSQVPGFASARLQHRDFGHSVTYNTHLISPLLDAAYIGDDEPTWLRTMQNAFRLIRASL